MKLSWFLVSALKAQDTLTCYECEYLWEEFEGVITPISGESSCRDGPLDKISSEARLATGTLGNEYEYARRCGKAHSIGTETIYDADTENPKMKEFHIFERKSFMLPADSPLVQHEGTLRLEEEGRLCGANQPQCTGPYVTSQPSNQPCETPNACPCLRCEQIRANQNGILQNIIGDDHCKEGQGMETTECVVGAGPERFHKMRETVDTNEFADEVSGTCYIWQETYRNVESNSIEMQSFVRSCDEGDERPMNWWSEINSKDDNMKLCQGDKCNIDDLETESSAAVYGLFGLLIMLL